MREARRSNRRTGGSPRAKDWIERLISRVNLAGRINPRSTSGYRAPHPASLDKPAGTFLTRGMARSPGPHFLPTPDALLSYPLILANSSEFAQTLPVKHGLNEGSSRLSKISRFCKIALACEVTIIEKHSWG